MEPKRSQKAFGAGTILASKTDTVPQGVLCRSPWLVLAPLGLHFGRFGHPVGSILYNFVFIIEHVGSIFYKKPFLSAPEYAEHLQITADTSIEGIVHP